MKPRLLKPAALLAAGLLGSACTSGKIAAGGDQSETLSGNTRTKSRADAADSRPSGGGSQTPNGSLEPENTQGDNWETIYERCTGDDYPVGYRPPTFIRPTTSNTGANCSGPSCPPNATLRPLGTDTISTPGVYENFYASNGLTIENVDGVTLRNFEIRCGSGGPYYGLSIQADNVLIEHGTIRKDSDRCEYGIIAAKSDTIRIRHMWIDQAEADNIQMNRQIGPTMVERSLFTRPGANGGSGVHADVWQYYSAASGTDICLLGSRAVPVYQNPNLSGPGCYKNSNLTQNGPDAPDKWYVYNNWVDGSTNNMIAGNGNEQVRNNKFGNFFQSSSFLGNDLGGNTWECNGSPATFGSSPPNCTWGFDTWRSADLDDWPPPVSCPSNFDDAPIDPTEGG